MSASFPVRVMVHESWDEHALDVTPDTTVADLKRAALEATRTAADPDECEVKYRGALLRDETVGLERAGVVPNAQLIVLRRRRQPVR